MNLPVIFQRAEGAALLGTSILIYGINDFSWLLFIALLFLVDLFMVGYLVNKTIGALSYNLGHSTVIPLVLTVAYFLTDNNTLFILGLIWFAHIGLDRMLGYGLKTEEGFTHTHLGIIGKKAD